MNTDINMSEQKITQKKNVILFPPKGKPQILAIEEDHLNQQFSKILEIDQFEKKSLHWMENKGYNLRLCGNGNINNKSSSDISNALVSYFTKDKINGLWIMYDINKNLDYDGLKLIVEKSKQLTSSDYSECKDYDII